MIDGIANVTQGIVLFSGDPSSVTPAEKNIIVPVNGRGWAYLHVIIAAHGSDTTTVAIKGRLNASGTAVALTKSDQSTACSVAQSGGAAVNTMTTVQLVPGMIVSLSGTSTTGASAKVWLEAMGTSSRTDA